MTIETESSTHTIVERDSTEDETRKTNQDHYIIQSGCVMVVYDRFMNALTVDHEPILYDMTIARKQFLWKSNCDCGEVHYGFRGSQGDEIVFETQNTSEIIEPSRQFYREYEVEIEVKHPAGITWQIEDHVRSGLSECGMEPTIKRVWVWDDMSEEFINPNDFIEPLVECDEVADKFLIFVLVRLDEDIPRKRLVADIVKCLSERKDSDIGESKHVAVTDVKQTIGKSRFPH